MKNPAEWIFPVTLATAVLKSRPLVLEAMERFGMDPWRMPGLTLADLCRNHCVAWDDFLGAVEGLAATPADADWTRLPVHHLHDFLTREHGEFTRVWLPDIQTALHRDPDSDRPLPGRLARLTQTWPGFIRNLCGHIREEEEFLYPRILRHEAALRTRRIDPDFSGGSVKVFVTLRLLKNELRLQTGMHMLLAAIRPRPDGDWTAGSTAEGTMTMVEAFYHRLETHSHLETDVLYPMSAAAEKALYDRHITGVDRTSVAA